MKGNMSNYNLDIIYSPQKQAMTGARRSKEGTTRLYRTEERVDW